MTAASTITTTAPSEAEIRAAIEAAPDGYDGVSDLTGKLYELFGAPLYGPGRFDPEEDQVGPRDLWVDLRASEAARLLELADEAWVRARQRVHQILVDELTAAALAFAAEYPEAPRP